MSQTAREMNTIFHAHTLLLFHDGRPWMKDKGDMFEQLLRQALSFSEQFTTIEPREMDIIFHARK